MKYRSEIDGLRALAVIPVIFFHAGISQFQGGFVGVDVFFVISGYLITSIILADIAAERFNILTFYERRARRILPALLFVAFASVPFAWAILLPEDFKEFFQSLAGVATFTSNIVLKTQSGYFETASELKPLLHTWSLGVEEQFYIIFPPLLLLLLKFGARTVVPALAALFVISLIYAHWAATAEPETAFFFLAPRAWELLVGVFAAFHLRNSGGKASLRLHNVLSATGMGLILFAVFVFDETIPFSSAFALVPTLGAALIILFATPGTYVQRLLSLRLLVGVGLISYSLYLWHQPVFAFYRYLGLPLDLMSVSLLLAAIFGGSILSWRFIETPARQSTLPRRRIFQLSLAGLGLALGVSLLAITNTKAADQLRFSKHHLNLVQSVDRSPMRESCHQKRRKPFDVAESCAYQGENVTWAIYGNSHGVELGYALSEILAGQGVGLRHFTVSGCGPAFGLEVSLPCTTFYQSRLDYLLHTPELQNIVLTFRSENDGEERVMALINLANHLAQSGKTAYLVLQAPTLPEDIRGYIARNRFSGVEDVISRSRADWNQINKRVYSALEKLDERVVVLDLANGFCDQENCFAIRKGKALYFDNSHMTVSGARIALQHVFP
jgi:peptidoglycan/LPS O-acetylase OafA/YrhL